MLKIHLLLISMLKTVVPFHIFKEIEFWFLTLLMKCGIKWWAIIQFCLQWCIFYTQIWYPHPLPIHLLTVNCTVKSNHWIYLRKACNCNWFLQICWFYSIRLCYVKFQVDAVVKLNILSEPNLRTSRPGFIDRD